MKNFTKYLLIVGCGFISACGGSSALPQSSIPPPANDCSTGVGCISVSSPDVSGLVTITADVGAVPNSSIVLVDLRETGLSSLIHSLDFFMSEAHAADVCASSLPECSETGSSEDCQITANADGSFIVRVFADVESSVSISYLDETNDCDESSAFEEAIGSTLATLDIEGTSLTIDDDNDLYIVGTDSEGLPAMRRVNIDAVGGSIGRFDVTSLNGSLNKIRWIDGDRFVVGTSVDNVIIDVAGDVPEIYSIFDTVGQRFLAMDFAVQRNYGFTGTSDDFACVTEYFGTTAERIFFVSPDSERGAPFNIIDSVDGQSPDFVARPVTYDFTSFSEITEGATFVEVINIFISSDQQRGFFIAEFDEGGTSQLYLIEIPMAAGFCLSTGVTRLNHPDLIVKPIGAAAVAPRAPVYFGEFSSDRALSSFMLIPDSEAGVYAFDMNEVAFTTITVSGATEEVNALSNVIGLIPLQMDDSSSQIEYAVVKQGYYLNLISLNTGDPDSLFAEASSTEIVAGISPVDYLLASDVDYLELSSYDDLILADLFTSTMQLVILSSGLDGDGESQIQVLEHADFNGN